MRFLSIYRSRETGVPPTPEHIATMEKLIEKFSASGHLISTEGCLPSRLGFRARRDDGKVTITDGPFTEAKEVVGGFALLNAESRGSGLGDLARAHRLPGHAAVSPDRLLRQDAVMA